MLQPRMTDALSFLQKRPTKVSTFSFANFETPGKAAAIEPVPPGALGPRAKEMVGTMPHGSGRFSATQANTRKGRPCSAEIRKRTGQTYDIKPRVERLEAFEKGGVAFYSGIKRFRRSIFPEYDQTNLGCANWAHNTHLEDGINEPDTRHFDVCCCAFHAYVLNGAHLYPHLLGLSCATWRRTARATT